MTAVADHFTRRELVAKARALIGEGVAQNAAAEAVGTSPATLCRWLGAYAQGGTAELAPKLKGRVGRKKLSHGATEGDRLALKRLKLATDSDRLALDMWAMDPRCSPLLRAAIQRPRMSKHNLPASLRQLCHVTEEERAKFRGEKAFQGAFVQQRDDTVVLADGTRRPMEAGDVFELDDMSSNQPCWWEYLAELDSPEEREANRLALRQAAAVGRQVLFARDVKSGRWLGFEIVGRPRDAYRAADILRFLRRLFETYGLPRLGLRLEGNVWRARVIAGVTLDETGQPTTRPEMAEEERRGVFGGMQEVGVSVDWCHASNHKGGIEGAFNHLQAIMAAQAVCEGDGRYVVDLGRRRGEFERGTKALMAAHAGRKHPRELGFWHISELQQRLERACAFDNCAEHKEGRIAQGVADLVWDEAIRRAPLRSLPKDKLWIFLPHESTCALRGAHVRGQLGGIVHHFCNPDLAAKLGANYPLRIRFDVAEPSLGAWIFNNAAPGERCNVDGLPLGAPLGWADYAPDAPQFDLQHGFDGKARKRFNAAVRSMFAAIGLHGRRAAVADESRDGRGGVRRVERAAPLAPEVGSPRLGVRDEAPVQPVAHNPSTGSGPFGRISAPAPGGSPSAPVAAHTPREIPTEAHEQPARRVAAKPARDWGSPDELDALEARLRERGALIG